MGRILPHGEGMLVHDAIDAVVIILQGAPVAQRADVVAECRYACGLDAAEYDLFTLCLLFHFPLLPYTASNLFCKAAQNLHALYQLLIRRGGEIQAEALRLIGLIRHKGRARHDRHFVFHRV